MVYEPDARVQRLLREEHLLGFSIRILRRMNRRWRSLEDCAALAELPYILAGRLKDLHTWTCVDDPREYLLVTSLCDITLNSEADVKLAAAGLEELIYKVDKLTDLRIPLPQQGKLKPLIKVLTNGYLRLKLEIDALATAAK